MAHTPAAASSTLLTRSDSLVDSDPPLHSRTSTTTFKSPDAGAVERENSLRSSSSDAEKVKPVILSGFRRGNVAEQLSLEAVQASPPVTSASVTPEKSTPSTTQSRGQPVLFSPPSEEASPSRNEEPVSNLSLRYLPGSFDDIGFASCSMGTLPASFATERQQQAIIPTAAQPHPSPQGPAGLLTSPPEFDVMGYRRGARRSTPSAEAPDHSDHYEGPIRTRRLSTPLSVLPGERALRSVAPTYSGQFSSPVPSHTQVLGGNNTPPSKSREHTPILPSPQATQGRFATAEEVTELRQVVNKLVARISFLEQGSPAGGSKIPATVVNRPLQPQTNPPPPPTAVSTTWWDRSQTWLSTANLYHRKLTAKFLRQVRFQEHSSALAYNVLVVLVAIAALLTRRRRSGMHSILAL